MAELIKINKKVYFENYRDIFKDSYKNNYPLPKLLSCITVPPKYQLKSNDLKNIKKTEEDLIEFEDNYNDMEMKYVDVSYEGDMDALGEQLYILWNEELLGFIAKFPKYQTILK